MAKSIRSKREKRLRAIRRDLVKPLLDEKDAGKLAALEAALAAPKLPVPTKSPFDMDVAPPESVSPVSTEQDLEMLDGDNSKTGKKPLGKKKKLKLRLAKKKRKGKGQFKRRHI